MSEPWPSTKSSSPAALGALDDEPLGRAGDEVGDDRVDGDPPARDRDPGLAGRDERGGDAARSRLAVELERDGHLPDRAVGADGEHDLAPALEVRAGRHVRGPAAAGAGRAARRRARAASSASSASSREELVQAVLDVEAVRDALRSSSRQAGGKRPPCGGDADERGRRLEAAAHRRPCRRSGSRPASPPARSSRASATTGRRGRSAGRRAPSCRSAGRRELPSARIR